MATARGEASSVQMKRSHRREGSPRCFTLLASYIIYIIIIILLLLRGGRRKIPPQRPRRSPRRRKRRRSRCRCRSLGSSAGRSCGCCTPSSSQQCDGRRLNTTRGIADSVTVLDRQVELSTNLRKVSQCPKKAPNRAISLLGPSH